MKIVVARIASFCAAQKPPDVGPEKVHVGVNELFPFEMSNGLGLLGEHAAILFENVTGQRGEKNLHDPSRNHGAERDDGIKAGEKVGYGTQCTGGDDAMRSERVLDLGDRWENEAVEVSDRASSGSQHSADEAAGTRLSDEFGLYPVRPSLHDGGDFVFSPPSEQPSVQKRGVWNIENVFERGVKRGLNFSSMANRRIIRIVEIRKHEGLMRRCFIDSEINPDQTLLLAYCKSRNTACLSGLYSRECGDTLTCSRPVVRPAVVSAHQTITFDRAQRERDVAMSATIQKGMGPVFRTKEDKRRIHERDRIRSISEFATFACYVPLVSKVDD